MGMFDTVLVNCPNCDLEVGFQSKSGDCMLKEYSLTNCPDDVLCNVNRHATYDCDCGVSFKIDVENRKSVIVNKRENNE